MILSPRNEVDLIWFFSSADDRSQTSTFGSMLERQKAASADSNGNPHPPAGQFNYIYVRKGKKQPPSYTPEVNGTSLRIGKISRKLQTLPLLYQNALATYYGHKGQRWETHFGRSRRCLCLIPFLPDGKRWFRPLYRKYGSISTEDILMCEIAAQQNEQNDIRDRQLYKLETAAYELRLDAEWAYQNSAE